MRVLVATRPFYGHLHPMVPVARALVRRGHDVRVATHAALATGVRASGLRLIEAGTDPRVATAHPHEDGLHPAWSTGAIRTKTLDLLRVLDDWRPDVVLREQTDFGALLYGELAGVPVAMLGPAMYIPPASWTKLFGTQMDPVRSGLGLPADPAFERINPSLYLDPTPSPYQNRVGGELAVRHETQPVPVGAGEAGPDWLVSLPRASTVYLTFGTVYNVRPRMLRQATQGLLDAGCDVVVTAGPGRTPDGLGLPDDPRVHAVDYLPQGQVLPHCSAVVSHGGFGSVMGAIWHGLPQVIVPLGSDNPTHASRCSALGLGVRLNAADVSEERVARLAERMLGSTEMRAAARTMGRRVRRMPAPEEGAVLLERLVEDGAPVRRVRTRGRARPRTAVAIPVLGRPELTRALLDDVAREPWVDPVVVDNGGDHVPVHGERVLRPGRNLGWAGACNLALEELSGRGYDAVVLLNNDTRLSSGFFAGLWRAHRRSGADLLAPVYDGTWPQQRSTYGGDAAGYPRSRVTRKVPFLDGTCLFLPRRTWEDVGLLDAASFPDHGWGVDLDYALRVHAQARTVAVTEESFLHHEGGGTASVSGEDWKVSAWQELAVGMRRKYGVAWPRLLRDRAGAVDPAPGPTSASALCPPVVVVGPPGSALRTAHRALNVLGVPPAPEPDQRRIDRVARELGLDRALPADYVPRTPDEVLGAAPLVAALDEVRAAVGGVPTDRPTLWSDPTGGALVPFWAAAYDADPLCVLVVRNPLDVADEIRAESGCDGPTALAVWERRIRLALGSVVGLPVLVTRLEDLLAVPEAWAGQVHRFLTTHGLPLLGAPHNGDVAEAVRGSIRRPRHAESGAMTLEQQRLYTFVLGLVGAHDRFPDAELPEESTGTDDLLRTRSGGPGVTGTGGTVTLRPEWVEWVVGNRGTGVEDVELLKVLVDRGLPPHEGRRALELVGTAESEPAYRTANSEAWDLLSGTDDASFGAPVRAEDLPGACSELEGPLPIPWEGIRSVLCLAGGGGRQAALFASLGLDVVVADLSAHQLELDRDAARRLGLRLETLQADAADLSALRGRRFDLVYQPVSMCYLPDPAAVHREVAQLLEPGGHYWVEHWNPVHMQLDRLGREGPPYRIVRPQGTERPVRFGYSAEELDVAGPDVAWHYVHPLSSLLGSLCQAGFEIVDLRERRHGDPTAAPGSEAHLEAHVPPFFGVLAQRIGAAS
ncbi:MAG: methyltransferase domain-containing protein [Actinomycetota bacterium]|nr:methyltransferase domain-containing protein [Actinomycetota bacterium]